MSKKIVSLDDITEEELKLLQNLKKQDIKPKQLQEMINRSRIPVFDKDKILDTSDRWKVLYFKIPDEYLKDKDHADILLWGDVHQGTKFCDEVYAKESLDLTAERGVYIIGMGDLLETAVRDSVGSGVYDQTSIVHEQIEIMTEWLRPHKDRIIGLLSGNHEDRIYDRVGIDVMRIMCKELNVNDLDTGRLICLQVGKQKYSLYVTHGSSGATLPYTKIKQCLALQQYVDADLYAMGHVHAIDSHSRAVHTIDEKTKKIIEYEKIFVITGHYLNYFGSYAHKKGLIPSKKGSPVIKLYKDEHKIRVSI